MIKLRDGSTINIEPKGAGLNIVLHSKTPASGKDGTKQEQTFTFALPMSLVPIFYGSLFGKNFFATKNSQQYNLVVMHAGMQKRPKQNKADETPAITNASMTQSMSTQPSPVASMLPGANDISPTSTQNTQNKTDTGSEKKENQIKDLELVNILVYEKQENGKRPPKYIAKFTISRVNILRLKQEVKKALKQAEKWSLRMRSITLTKAGPVMIISQNAKQIIIDYTNKDELKDDLTEFIMSNREECTINKIKFTKDDAMTLLSLLTHMEI